VYAGESQLLDILGHGSDWLQLASVCYICAADQCPIRPGAGNDAASVCFSARPHASYRCTSSLRGLIPEVRTVLITIARSENLVENFAVAFGVCTSARRDSQRKGVCGVLHSSAAIQLRQCSLFFAVHHLSYFLSSLLKKRLDWQVEDHKSRLWNTPITK
jgi:hypothetical protein